MQKSQRSGGRKWLAHWVLAALKDSGGEGSKRSITRWILKRVEGELVAGDHVHMTNGETRIEVEIAFMRNDLVKDGRMELGTLKDVWRISEKGRRWLEQNPASSKRGNLKGYQEDF